MFKVFKSRLGKKYLYETTTNQIFEADDESIERLGSTEGETSFLRRISDDFYNEFFCNEESIALSVLRDDMVPDSFEQPEILVLELTQQCNFRCEYCIYSGSYRFERKHGNTQTNETDIERICSAYFGSGRDPSYVSFYGGEPLLRFDLIKRLCERVENLGGHPEYSITTNGSLLLDRDILTFLMDRGFHINVSFDGLNHDLYRRTVDGRPSSAMVLEALNKINELNCGYFEKNVTISTTLAPPYDLLANASFFMGHELLSRVRVSVNLVNEADNSFLDSFDLAKEKLSLASQIKVLADAYIDCNGRVPYFIVSLFANSASRIDERGMFHQTHAYPPGQCEVGRHRLFVTADGRKYTCERVGGYGCLGHLDEDVMNIDAYKRVINDVSDFYERHCGNCHLVRICDMCCSSMRRGIEIKDDELATAECDDRRKWYDTVFYVYLSRKELGKGMFDD